MLQNIHIANKKVLEIFDSANPVLTDVAIASDVIPGLEDDMILHAGPPIEWRNMCGPMKGAILGALVYEKRASSLEEAQSLVDRGEVRFAPNHDHSSVAPMAGIISPSMPVWVLEDKTHNTVAYSNFNEGPGAMLRYGANGPEVIERLNWIEKVLAPRIKKALRKSSGFPIFKIIKEALTMGDECHARNRAAHSLFQQLLLPPILQTDLSSSDIKEVYDFLIDRDYFFLNLSMAACKAAWLRAESIPNSSIVTAFSRNGVEFGIRVQGRWFAAPSPTVTGKYFPSFCAADANKDIGDSAITEASGLGGFAAAGAPAVTGFVGGTVRELVGANLEMYDITLGESKHFSLPVFENRGTPTGLDVVRVVQTRIQPFVTTGIAHRLPGIGQVGAGRVRVPLECFDKAAQDLNLI